MSSSRLDPLHLTALVALLDNAIPPCNLEQVGINVSGLN
jgi:hypothetical protein